MHRVLRFVLPVLLVLVAQQPGWAQIEIEAKPPETRPRPRLPTTEIIAPPGAREITRPRESDFYPEDIRVRHDPAFFGPFTSTRQTGPKTAVQFGVAGWTSPNTPVAHQESYFRENPGWFAIGFSFVWDVPVEPVPPASPGPPR